MARRVADPGPSMTAHALFRCDASPKIGAGHLTRCLALAEALVETGWRVEFAVDPQTRATMQGLGAGEFRVNELSGIEQDEPAKLRGYFPDGVDLLVTDHYQRDIAFERACRGFARRILVLDDATGRHHDCDFLVDAAANNPSTYAGCVPANTKLLLGPSYALVRRAFIERRADALRRRDGRGVKNILVSFGATDPLNLTSVTLDALGGCTGEISITVALSSRAPHVETVRHKLRDGMRLVLDADMATLMTEADIAIGAAGASSYERAVLGLPSIIAVIAENQRGIAKILGDAGAAVDAGPLNPAVATRLGQIVRELIAKPSARTHLSEACAPLVDGCAAQRLLIALAGAITTSTGYDVRLRLADSNDERWLFQLQQAPQTRRHFRNAQTPRADEHARWMARTLADQNVLFLVIEADRDRAGYVRLDKLHGKEAAFEISLAVRPQFYRHGVASAALKLARRVQPAAVFDAEILPDNIASKALFTRAGFRHVNGNHYQQVPAFFEAKRRNHLENRGIAS